MEQDFDVTTASKISKINAAGMINSTLINLENDFFRHYRAGLYLSANSDLDCIWVILGGEEDVVAESKTEKEYKEIESKLSNSGKLQDGFTGKGFETITENELNKFRDQKPLLLEKARFLHRLMNAQGKGTAYSNEDDEDTE